MYVRGSLATRQALGPRHTYTYTRHMPHKHRESVYGDFAGNTGRKPKHPDGHLRPDDQLHLMAMYLDGRCITNGASCRPARPCWEAATGVPPAGRLAGWPAGLGGLILRLSFPCVNVPAMSCLLSGVRCAVCGV